MKKETIKKIKQWCRDFEKQTELYSEPDTDTFEGEAYSLFQNLLADERKKPREIEMKETELTNFFKNVCEGIRGEYEQGWSHRKFSEDKKKMRKIFDLLVKRKLEKDTKQLKSIATGERFL